MPDEEDAGACRRAGGEKAERGDVGYYEQREGGEERSYCCLVDYRTCVVSHSCDLLRETVTVVGWWFQAKGAALGTSWAFYSELSNHILVNELSKPAYGSSLDRDRP